MVFENEPSESDVMQRPPRDAQAPLFAGMTLALALLQGLGVLAVVLCICFLGVCGLMHAGVSINEVHRAHMWQTVYKPDKP